jgi:hypothetical protein
VDSTEYLYDGSLIIGTDRDNVNLTIFHSDNEESSPDNPWRHLLPLTPTSGDSTSYPYRYAEGRGCTEDSTIEFRSRFYAPKHPDSLNFYIAHFDVYAGPNWSEPITDVKVAYAADWNVPSDTGNNNSAGLLPDLQALYQKGEYAGSPDLNDDRYGCIAYRSDLGSEYTAAGGFVWDSDRYITPYGGHQVDSLLKYIGETAVTPYFTLNPDENPITDYSSVLVIDRDAAIGTDDTLSFSIVVGATNPKLSKSSADVEALLEKAECFIKSYIAPESDYCDLSDCGCGDADGDGFLSISDAIYLLNYFGDGNYPPDPLCMGEADHCDGLDFNDMVYIMCYIYSSCVYPCDASVNCNYPAGNTMIVLGCPVLVEDAHGGTAVVSVYLDNDVDLASVSAGFHYNSDDIDVDSVSFVGSMLQPGVSTLSLLFPEEHLVWLGGIGDIESQEGGLLANIYVSVPPLTPNQVIDFDTSFVPRVGSPAFMLDGGDKLIPPYVDCGDADLIIDIPPLKCGDADLNQLVNVSDAVYLINYIFGGGPAPLAEQTADVDCNGVVNISDAVYLISYIFGGGPEPCAACR